MFYLLKKIDDMYSYKLLTTRINLYQIVQIFFFAEIYFNKRFSRIKMHVYTFFNLTIVCSERMVLVSNLLNAAIK